MKGINMNVDEYIENEIFDTKPVIKFIENIKNKSREMVLTSDGGIVGAVITREQYSWFLDQLDSCQDISFIEKRVKNREGSQSLESFKREIK